MVSYNNNIYLIYDKYRPYIKDIYIEYIYKIIYIYFKTYFAL